MYVSHILFSLTSAFHVGEEDGKLRKEDCFLFFNPLPFETPISLTYPSLYGDSESLFEFPEPYSKFPLAIYFTYGNVSFHVTRKEDFLLAPLEWCTFSFVFQAIKTMTNKRENS